MAETIYEKVTSKGKELEPIFKRMDKDRDLLFMKAYQMLYPAKYGAKAMEDVINVTLNDPTTFAMRAIATLNSTQRQTVVEGREKKEKLFTLVENFIDDMSYSIDDFLAGQGLLTLDSFLNEQVCVRGPIVGRVTLREENSEFVPEVRGLDSRFFVYEMGGRKMNWGAPIFRRSKQDILAEYGEDPNINRSLLTSLGEENELVDFWDSKKNTIILNKKDL